MPGVVNSQQKSAASVSNPGQKSKVPSENLKPRCKDPVLDQLLFDAAAEMDGHFVQPIPTAEFFARFMPLYGSKKTPIPQADFSNIPTNLKPTCESHMYKSIADSIELQKLCPSLTTIIDSRDDRFLEPAVALYKPQSAVGQITQGTTNRNTWRDMELGIEIKTSLDANPLCDLGTQSARDSQDPDSYESPFKAGTITRGQMILNAAAQMSRQQRLFLFSLGIFGHTARFFRWDRAGAVISQTFNYKQQPEILVEFFHRFNNLTAEQRGHDPTAVPATLEEERLLRDQLQKSFELHSEIETTFNDTDFPIWKLYVGDGPSQPKRAFIVGRPLFFQDKVVGRCTRGYIALSLDENRLMFLKDTWRPVSRSVTPEWETYKLFKDSNGHCIVKNIVPFFCGEDVIDDDRQFQKTVSQKINQDTNMRPFVHSRMVQDAICRPLKDFKNSRDLVKLIRDGLEALDTAWEKARIYHRDVSSNNIMISPEGVGLLNDWDLCLSRDSEIQSQGRTGTWQFMSNLLLRDPGRKREIYDDLESAFWVLAYYALRFVKHNMSFDQNYMSRLFDDAYHGTYQGEPCLFGGREKRAVLSMDLGGYWDKLEFDAKPLTILFDDLMSLFSGIIFGQRCALSGTDPDTCPYYVTCREELQSPKKFLELFQKALDRDDWPVDDKVPDQIIPSEQIYYRKTFLYTGSSCLARKHYSQSFDDEPSNKRLKNSLEI